jgi:hypothetical protein
MKTVFHFYVEIPGVINFTFFGGGLKPSRPGYVWLATPVGKPILEVPRAWVHPTTYEEIDQRILADRRAAREERVRSTKRASYGLQG